MSRPLSANLGYPRIGEKREWKKALEQYWAGKLSRQDLLAEMKHRRLVNWQKQREAGIDLIPVGDFSLYDHVLDTAFMFNVIPARFRTGRSDEEDAGDLDVYFAVARGKEDAVAAAMTKWFNTNYHYIVPELHDARPKVVHNWPLYYFQEAKKELGIKGKPVLVGPVTFVKLAKGYQKNEFDEQLARFVPLYAEVLQQLAQAGAEWVQIDEPVLSSTLESDDIDRFYRVYQQLAQAAPNLKLLLQTYFDGVSAYEDVVKLPVAGIGLDFVHDRGENLKAIKRHGFPQDKVLGCGIVDGRNVWRANLQSKLQTLEEIRTVVGVERLIIQPSSSLLHVPVTVKNETKLDASLVAGMAFADEKLEEVTVLTKALSEGEEAVGAAVAQSLYAVESLNESASRNVPGVAQALRQLDTYRTARTRPYPERKALQDERFHLPELPTTTIGSLPQTAEVRRARARFRKGESTPEAYEQFVQNEIKKWIEIQEEIGLDVLVHGEFERNDMVEYFGEKLGGFVTTENGWVQSYGSRCVKPPILYGDVYFRQAMTVQESVYAQTLTEKPVKGMLTGPVTILNWSFVRDDRPWEDALYQVALALRKEVETLEAHGIGMIQVDEPALREGLPLKKERWPDYLDKAVHAFRLTTAVVRDDTQIHTHMCYSEFQDIIDAIKALDADVIAIEAARSHGALISVFEEKGYDKGIGLGVYDIHSPRVPSHEEIEKTVARALKVLDRKLFWINPDCGLKTRKKEEVVPALKAMVQAAKDIREKTVLTS